MTISQRQFTLLNEMGISLWQRRDLPEKTSTKISLAKKQTIALNTKKIDLSELNQQQIFADILLSLNLLPRDINVNNEQLMLKQLTWQLTSTEEIDLSKNVLTTPKLNNITQSTILKRQLWQAIQEHSIQKHSLQEQTSKKKTNEYL